MNKALFLITISMLLSCTDSNNLCNAERQKINDYYDTLIDNPSMGQDEIYKLNQDRIAKLNNLKCN